MKKFLVKDVHYFHEFVKNEIVPLVKPHTLFLLSGEVGAGKTELVKTVAENFRMNDVQSPTFAFHQAYENKEIILHHVDLYRLRDEEDLESIGFWDLFDKEGDVIFVEWANMILSDTWPWGWNQIQIEIKKVSASEREITVKMPNA